MRRFRSLRWWGLFALIPLTVALMVLDDEASFSQTWRLVLLAAIVCGGLRAGGRVGREKPPT